MKLIKQLLKNHHCDRCGDWVWRTYENKNAVYIRYYGTFKERLCKSCYAPNWD